LFPLGTPAEEIPERLRIYQSQRYERSHHIQEFTRLSGADVAEGKALDMQKFTAFNVGHDEWDSSTGALQRLLAEKHMIGKWQPFGFALNQREAQELREWDSPTMTTLSVKFRASRTYLQNLLPPGFSYISPATVCEASLVCTTTEEPAWLANGRHSSVELRLHGIKYVKSGGEPMFGAFVPVVFNNFASSMMVGGADQGMPQIYSDIDITHDEDHAAVNLSWRGANFGKISVHGLREKVVQNGDEEKRPQRGPGPPPPPPEAGTFAWRQVSAVGQIGKAESDHAIFPPYPDSAMSGGVEKVLVGHNASIDFKAGDWQQLPTLHHVARVLAELPRYGVVESTYSVRSGARDTTAAQRIE
jgi:hypothetical protein